MENTCATCKSCKLTVKQSNSSKKRELSAIAAPSDFFYVCYIDIYSDISNRKSASRALKETCLLQELELKTDMPVMLHQNL